MSNPMGNSMSNPMGNPMGNTMGNSVSNPMGNSIEYGQINQRFKTQKCRHFENKGYCQYNEHCQYAHGDAELRDINDPIPEHLRSQASRRIVRGNMQGGVGSQTGGHGSGTQGHSAGQGGGGYHNARGGYGRGGYTRGGGDQYH